MKTHSIFSRIISITLSLLIMLPFIVSEGMINGLKAHASGFEEGYYFIKHFSSGRYVDVTDMSTDNGTQLQLWDKYQYHTNQVFKFERVDGDYWKITSLYNGKAIEVSNSGKKDNDKVQQWDYGNIACQQWEIEDLGSGKIKLKNRNSGKYLNTYQAKSNNGTKLVQYESNSKDAQLFYLEDIAIGANGAEAQRIQNEKSCYIYLKEKGLNNAVISGVLASMYIENRFVFGTEALDFYWNDFMDNNSILGSAISKIARSILLYRDNSADSAAAIADSFTDLKQQRFFNTLSDTQLLDERKNAATLAKNYFWPRYFKIEQKARMWNMEAFQQDIGAWRDINYPDENNKIWKCGCGIISYMNVIYALIGEVVDPEKLVKNSIDTNSLTYGNNFKAFFEGNPLNKINYTGDIRGGNWEALKNKLTNGEVAIMSVPGHYIVISAYNPEDDTYRVLDCAAGDRDYGGYRDLNGGTYRPTSNKGTWMKTWEFNDSNHLSFWWAYTFSVDPSQITSINGGGASGYGYNPMTPGVYKLIGDMYIRSGPSINYPDLGVVPAGTEIEITELDNYSWGKTVYNGLVGWVNVNLSYATYIRPLELIKKPVVPTLSLSSATDVAINAISTVSWNAVNSADNYTITVYDESGKEVFKQPGITATSSCFTLSDPGTYTVKAVAVNSKYTSDVATLSQKITVHPNSTVIFLSEADGNELNKQSVPYGADAATPETPSKKGFTFIGWDGNYTAVKQDTTIIAKWQRNKYNVNFYNGTGSTLDSQRILYEDAAVEPQAPTMEGYAFKGWDKKFDYIEDNMDIYPIFAWEKEDLPVIISNVKAERDSAGYNVSYSLQNAPGQSTQCRLVISLKTAEGKLITYTESNAYNLREESVITDTIYVPSQEVASIVDINAVRKFTLVIPIAENISGEVTGDAFTNWSTEEPPEDALKVEQQTEYRYRTKTIKESNEKLPSPWVLENETTGYTDYGPEQRSDSPVAASDTRSVEVKTEQHHDFTGYRLDYYCTQYYLDPYYRHYRGFSIGGDYGRYEARPSYTEHTNTNDPNWAMYATQAELDAAGKVAPGGWFDGFYGGYNKDPNRVGYYFQNHWDPNIRNYLWFVTGETYNDYTTTYYIYKDREKIPVYTYSQLSDYSIWSTEKPEESDNKVIEERVVYRYIPADTITTENTDGEMRTISGSVDPVFAGKQAILFVYKIDEAADYTNEAVAQTVIGKNGEYSFEFKLREEPTSVSINGEKKPTGDFTVTLGIEGATSVIYLDPIKAPTPEYTVEYVDYDGKVLLSTKVKDGEAAPIPESIPERKGYTFAGWNNDPSAIHSNTTMTAIYTKNTYTVAFVDWYNESVVLQQYNYGDPILPPEAKTPEGYVFKGWDILIEENPVVTENIVATAIYELKQLEVSFVDYDDKVITTKTVQYGNTVELPDALENQSDRSFVCWSIDGTSIITDNTVVRPIVYYTETALTPVVSLESDSYDTAQMVEITTTDKSKIFYTLDGTDPSENGIEYKEAITLEKSCVLKCIAMASNKNNSEIITMYYAINTSNSVTDYMAYDLLPEYVRNNASDYNVISTKGYRYIMKEDVESKKRYDNLIDSGWKTSSEIWSEWSDWTTSLNDTSDLIIEQKSKDAEPIEVPFYQYSHWKYYDEDTQKYQYSAKEVDGVECKYESIESPDKLTIAAFIDGTSTYSLNGQVWFNQESITKSVIPNDKLYQYRYKKLTMTKLSDWVEKLPEGTEAIEEGEVFCYKEPARFILTITDDNGTMLYKDFVTANEPLKLDIDQFKRSGYTFEGLFSSEGQKWDVDKDIAEENITLIAKFSPIQYTVKFLDEEIVLSTKTVDCFSYAAPPDMYNKEGMVFAGWDNEGYLNVTEDLIVKAKYIPAEDAPSLSVAKTKYYLFPNSQTVLKVQTTNIASDEETIIWTSMNPDVVTVSDNGIATAHSIGEADIVITEASTGLVTVCTVVSVDSSIDENPPTTDITTTTTTTITTTTTTTTTTSIPEQNKNNLGDVNDDGQINAVDASSVLSYYAMISTNKEGGYTEDQKLTADVNNDGQINAVDASFILSYYAYVSTTKEDIMSISEFMKK